MSAPPAPASATSRTSDPALDPEPVESALHASRAVVDIVARSLLEVGTEVTLPQYRVLVLVDSGVARGVELAHRLDVHPSTVGRLVDKLVAKDLVRRREDPRDRRSNLLSVTPAGSRLVAVVNDRRRTAFSAVMSRLTDEEVATVVTGLELLSRAAELSGHGTPGAPAPSTPAPPRESTGKVLR